MNFSSQKGEEGAAQPITRESIGNSTSKYDFYYRSLLSC